MSTLLVVQCVIALFAGIVVYLRSLDLLDEYEAVDKLESHVRSELIAESMMVAVTWAVSAVGLLYLVGLSPKDPGAYYLAIVLTSLLPVAQVYRVYVAFFMPDRMLHSLDLHRSRVDSSTGPVRTAQPLPKLNCSPDGGGGDD